MDAQPDSRASVNRSDRKGELLDEVLHHSGALLRSQARRNASSHADAEDALQEACLLFLRQYDGPLRRGDAVRWIQLVVKRCAWQLGRKVRREAPDFEAGVPEGLANGSAFLSSWRRGPSEFAELESELSERRELLACLKPDERRAIVLVGLGYSYKEIGERCGWTHTKINRCLAEGRAALRKMLEGER